MVCQQTFMPCHGIGNNLADGSHRNVKLARLLSWFRARFPGFQDIVMLRGTLIGEHSDGEAGFYRRFLAAALVLAVRDAQHGDIEARDWLLHGDGGTWASVVFGLRFSPEMLQAPPSCRAGYLRRPEPTRQKRPRPSSAERSRAYRERKRQAAIAALTAA